MQNTKWLFLYQLLHTYKDYFFRYSAEKEYGGWFSFYENIHYQFIHKTKFWCLYALPMIPVFMVTVINVVLCILVK